METEGSGMGPSRVAGYIYPMERVGGGGHQLMTFYTDSVNLANKGTFLAREKI